MRQSVADRQAQFPLSFDIPRPQLPKFQRRVSANGIRVAWLDWGASDSAHLLCALPFGGQDDPLELAGLSAFLAPVLKSDPRGFEAGASARQVAVTGSTIGVWADWESTVFAIDTTRPFARAMLELLSGMVYSPTFSPSVIEAVRRRQQGAVRRSQSQPSRVADQQFARLVYGRQLYGRPLIGDAESIARIEGRHLSSLYDRAITGRPAYFVLVGRLPWPQLNQVLDRLPAVPAGSPWPLPDAPPAPSADRIRAQIVDAPGSALVELRVGHHTVSRKHPEFHLLRLLSRILSSRLMTRLRQSRGMTYRVESRMEARLGPGPLMISTAVPHSRLAEATRLILEEMERLRGEEVPADELIGAKQQFVGGYLRSTQSARQIAVKIKQLVSGNLPGDYFDRQLADIRKVEAAELKRVAGQHLHPEGVAIVAVGAKEQVQPELARLVKKLP